MLEDRPTPGWEFTANGFTLTFTDTSSGNLSNVSWTFDDGTSSTFLDPVHTFPGPGNYYVCQTWDSPCGPLQTCKSIGISQPKTLLCGKDEVGFTQARASEYDSLTVGQGAGADADLVGQLFRAPQSIVVHGFTFYASHNSNADSAFRVDAYLYNASNVGLVDTLIASTTLRVDRSRELVFQGASQPNPVRMTAYNATFRAPVEVNSDYVVAIEPNTISEISILTNRWRAAMPNDQDGNGDGFSLINEGVNWTKGLNVQPDGGFAFDADFIFEPLVEYSLNANFDKDPECIETPALVTFNNLSAPILLDPMYNVNAFNNNTEASFVWEFGDTLNNPQNVINPLHSYTQDGPFEVSMEVTMNGWTTSCMNAQVDSVFSLPIPDFNIIQAPGFNTVIFQNTSVNATEYLWSFGDGGFSNSISPTHFYQTVDSFTVCLAASNQCDARQICKTVVVVVVGIPELPGLENLTVYPNPARNNVYVAANLNVPTDLTIELLDLTGRVLNSIRKPGAMTFEQPIDITGLARGTYLVRVNNGQESIVKKISILE
ncbi:MAG: PKD domain-containing protein [Bacteroidota bacterium]